jgi:hypothetical protein
MRLTYSRRQFTWRLRSIVTIWALLVTAWDGETGIHRSKTICPAVFAPLFTHAQ